jgi:hypothetical protein
MSYCQSHGDHIIDWPPQPWKPSFRIEDPVGSSSHRSDRPGSYLDCEPQAFTVGKGTYGTWRRLTRSHQPWVR